MRLALCPRVSIKSSDFVSQNLWRQTYSTSCLCFIAAVMGYQLGGVQGDIIVDDAGSPKGSSSKSQEKDSLKVESPWLLAST
jgi:hypothetical protein